MYFTSHYFFAVSLTHFYAVIQEKGLKGGESEQPRDAFNVTKGAGEMK